MQLVDNLYQTVCVNLPLSWNNRLEELATPASAYLQSYSLSKLLTGPLGSRMCTLGMRFATIMIGFVALKILSGMYNPPQSGDSTVFTNKNIAILSLTLLQSFWCPPSVSFISAIAITQNSQAQLGV